MIPLRGDPTGRPDPAPRPRGRPRQGGPSRGHSVSLGWRSGVGVNPHARGGGGRGQTPSPWDPQGGWAAAPHNLELLGTSLAQGRGLCFGGATVGSACPQGGGVSLPFPRLEHNEDPPLPPQKCPDTYSASPGGRRHPPPRHPQKAPAVPAPQPPRDPSPAPAPRPAAPGTLQSRADAVTVPQPPQKRRWGLSKIWGSAGWWVQPQ